MEPSRSAPGQQPPPGSDSDGGTADLAREEAEGLKDDTKEQAQAVASTASEGASEVAHEAVEQTRELVHEAKHQLLSQARSQTDHLGGALEQLGGNVHALAEGRPEEAGPVGDYVERIAGHVDELAGRVDELGFDGMLDEVQRYARRRPGMFLAAAALGGFAVSRLARGAQASQDDQSSSATSQQTSGAAPAPTSAPPPVPAVTTPPPTPVPPPDPMTPQPGRFDAPPDPVDQPLDARQGRR